MGLIYEICADEAWTHRSQPLTRYWCFLGGLLGQQPDVDRLENALGSHLAAIGHRAEVKWSATTPVTLPLFKHLVDILFQHLHQYPLQYRQTFLDRSFVHVPAPGEPQRSDLDVQFLIYYQFVKHHFGIEHLPAAVGSAHRIILRLDNHSSQAHKSNLVRFVKSLPAQLGRPDLSVQVTFINSKRLRRLQLCDLLMGAAGFHGNRMRLRRDPGQRGMKPRQKARHELATYIYNKFRHLDSQTRGSKVFHWFESTGLGGIESNSLNHKVRIWKFIPSSCRVDYGFYNKHLDRQGRYRGPRWHP